MQKRQYPLSLFIGGVILNLIKTFYMLILIVILFIIGAFGLKAFTNAALILLALDLIWAIALQIRYRSILLKDSDNPEYNDILDQCFGRDEVEQEDDSNH